MGSRAHRLITPIALGTRRLRPLGPVAVIAGVIALLPFPTCVVRIIFGVPCPGCGMTRAVLALARLDVAASVALNPLSVPLALLAFGTVLGAFVLDEPRWKRVVAVSTGVGGVALILVWALRFAGLFGGPVPP